MKKKIGLHLKRWTGIYDAIFFYISNPSTDIYYRQHAHLSRATRPISLLQKRQEKVILLEVFQCIENIMSAIEEKKGNVLQRLGIHHRENGYGLTS